MPVQHIGAAAGQPGFDENDAFFLAW